MPARVKAGEAEAARAASGPGRRVRSIGRVRGDSGERGGRYQNRASSTGSWPRRCRDGMIAISVLALELTSFAADPAGLVRIVKRKLKKIHHRPNWFTAASS
jgi:hypothetical protein